MIEPTTSFEVARKELGLSVAELWFQYFALGGMRSALEVEAFLYGALEPTAHDRDLLAVALNERFAARGDAHPIPYSDDVLIVGCDSSIYIIAGDPMAGGHQSRHPTRLFGTGPTGYPRAKH